MNSSSVASSSTGGITSTRRLRQISLDLAYSLSSLPSFLPAAQQVEVLIAHTRFTLSQFRQHGKRLIALMEIARSTLTRAGVKLHLFTSCPAHLLPYKSQYFKLLLQLQRHRQRFAPDLRVRLHRLLLPLSTRLVIHRKSDPADPFAELGIDRALVSASVGGAAAPGTGDRQLPQRPVEPSHASSSSSSSAKPSPPETRLMPPPDAFPAKVAENPLTTLRKKHLRTSSVLRAAATSNSNSTSARPVHRQHPKLEPDPDPAVDMPVLPRRSFHGPRRRQFGIFCTRKQAGHLARREAT